VAEKKTNPYKKSVSSSFGEMSGRSVIGSANQSDDESGESFPILVHTDLGPVVCKLTDDCSGDYNAWVVRGDIPEPPFPTEDLFCNSNYRLEEIQDAELTISGTQVILCVNSGTISGDDIDDAEAMMKWYEIGKRS
jgi:hypothetical protein